MKYLIIALVFIFVGCAKPTINKKYRLLELCDTNLFMYDYIPGELKRIQKDKNGKYKTCDEPGYIVRKSLEE